MGVHFALRSYRLAFQCLLILILANQQTILAFLALFRRRKIPSSSTSLMSSFNVLLDLPLDYLLSRFVSHTGHPYMVAKRLFHFLNYWLYLQPILIPSFLVTPKTLPKYFVSIALFISPSSRTPLMSSSYVLLDLPLDYFFHHYTFHISLQVDHWTFLWRRFLLTSIVPFA